MNTVFRFLLLGLLAAVPALAQVPRTISYQGVLADAAGTFLADGNHQLTLRLYDNAGATTPLYTEVQTVTIVRGLFNAIIGSVTPIPSDLRFDRAYFLGVSVNGGAELAPRTALTSVPYALRAAVADVAASVAPNAPGIVTSLNGSSGALTLQGAGGTTVTGGGGTITISSTGVGGTGIQGVQSPDASIGVTNPNGPVASINIAPGGVRSVHIADGSITEADIASGVLPNTSTFLSSGSAAGGVLTGTYPNPDIAPGVLVRSINGLRDNVTIAAGSNVTLTPSGNTLTIAASGTSSGGLQRVQSTDQSLAVSNGNGPIVTVNVAANGIGTAHIQDDAVTPAKLNTSGASTGQVLTFNGSGAAWSGAAGLSGSGSSGRIAYWTGAGSLSSDVALRFSGGIDPTLAFGSSGTYANGKYAVSIGGGNTVDADYGIAIAPSGAFVYGTAAMAFGASTASGTRSIVIGHNLYSSHTGAMMLGDNSAGQTLNSTAANQLSARFNGGYRFTTNSSGSTGVTMAGGVSGWTNICDRNLKEHISDIDGESVLAAFRSMPISEWSYRDADPSIRYMGPMAQDFHQAFHLGGSDSTGINSIVADGVSMAAIQALERRTMELRATLLSRTEEIATLRTRIDELTAVLHTVVPGAAKTPKKPEEE